MSEWREPWSKREGGLEISNLKSQIWPFVFSSVLPFPPDTPVPAARSPPSPETPPCSDWIGSEGLE